MLAASMTTLAQPSTLRQLLAQRDYVLFWLNRFSAVIAVQIQSVAIGWQVYAVARQTGSVAQGAFMVGMIGLAQFLALLAFTLNAGEAADRLDRRKIMATALCVEVASAALLAWLAWRGDPQLWPIFAVALGFGAARAFYSPASGAMGPMLVPREILPRAIAFNSLAWQSGAILGPAIGGLLCAVSPTAAFATSMVIYLFCIGLVLAIRTNTKPASQGGSRMALIREGLAYVWSNKIVLGATSLDLFAVLLGGATALLPVFARDVLHVGAEGFGILRASPAIGATAIAILMAVRPIRRHAGLWMFAGVALFGVATIVFGLSRSLWVSVVALAILGGADMVSVFVRGTLVQLVTPDAMRGRVMAVGGLFIGASNELGEFESGVAARFLGPVGAAIFGGVGAIVVTGTWAWLFPALRKADRLA
jgi:MFS family permease